MADRLYLSCRLRGYTEHNMLRHFEKLLRLFPYSTQAPALALRVLAVSYNEAPVFERVWEEGADPGEVITAAREFHHADCASEVEGFWDVWQFDETWKLTPSPVVIAGYGPQFEDSDGEHVRVDFGTDADFLPQPERADSLTYVQSNIKGLLRFVHELDTAMAVEHRRLESESGENFAERLQAALKDEVK